MSILLVGESNPYGGDPYYALYPAPEGCSGHRLCCLIIGMSRHDYFESFHRANLCVGEWSLREARVSAEALWAKPDKFVLCGAKVCAAWKTPFVPFAVGDGGKTSVVPHPSGRNRLWDQPGIIALARTSLKAFAPEIAHLIREVA